MIKPPRLISAKAGDPITSEKWNNVLQAIRNLYDELNKISATLTVEVKDNGNGNSIPNAIVTVVPTGDPVRPVRSGLYAGANIKRYLVENILPGTYNIIVEASGFTTETRGITISEKAEPLNISIPLKLTEPLFKAPDIFGISLDKAVDIVARSGFLVSRIIDSHGKDIPPGAIPADVATALVLGQVPEAGALLPRNTPIRIHIAAQGEVIKPGMVIVPNLVGLTVTDAQKKLTDLGLKSRVIQVVE
ncbi:MAG: PASTA domain-containing protein [Acidobacteriota bacterium]